MVSSIVATTAANRIIQVQPKKITDESMPTLVSGLFNAKHTSWNRKTINATGTKLLSYRGEKEAIVIGPTENAYILHNTIITSEVYSS